MHPELVIVGAGGLGREVVSAVAALAAAGAATTVRGFLDDSPPAAEIDGVTVLGPLDAIADHTDADVVVCVGAPERNWTRKRVVDRLALAPERYATIVHPSAVLPAGTTLGHGSIVLAGVIATAPITFGAHVVVMPGTIFTHDDVIADYVTFASGVRLSGEVTVEEGAYVGAGALVRERVRVGTWSTIGMGAVVLDDVPAEEVWVGAPARHLRRSEAPAGVRG